MLLYGLQRCSCGRFRSPLGKCKQCGKMLKFNIHIIAKEPKVKTVMCNNIEAARNIAKNKKLNVGSIVLASI